MHLNIEQRHEMNSKCNTTDKRTNRHDDDDEKKFIDRSNDDKFKFDLNDKTIRLVIR